jgi:A/G-specific adenine glycosylase
MDLMYDEFRHSILIHYGENMRSMPWRETHDPYAVLISEFMLQQTQTVRVLQKYPGFLTRFPNFDVLASAQPADVIREWQGLGYNRRALALHRTAQQVVSHHGGVLPSDPQTLLTFPGIGPYTAGAIAAFAFGVAVPIIETNIRRVFIHWFFPDREDVRDAEILPLVEESLDTNDPRTWYYALMDYGVMLKQTRGNANTRSAHYSKQSKFEGSDRQIRGAILRILGDRSGLIPIEIVSALANAEDLYVDPERLVNILRHLLDEGFLCTSGDPDRYDLA